MASLSLSYPPLSFHFENLKCNFQATDNDAEKPNNIVRYEIISGNYENKFGLNEITGELFIRGQLTNRNLRQSEPQDGYYNSQSDDGLTSVIVLTVRAYDLGNNWL